MHPPPPSPPLFEQVWGILQENVFNVPSTDRLFNLYRDRDDELDLPDAPAIRKNNLRAFLASYAAAPPLFLLAEAPGPWGCRFSGVPITSEEQLLDPHFPIHGSQSSSASKPHSEYSANIHWRILRPYFPHFITWNAVPFHPRSAHPLSIRTPTGREVDAYADIVRAFLDAVRPERVIAIGRKAERALNHLGAASIYVRHPSQGGSRLFEQG
ncbi:MAG: uracil-DNA glycosylase, partial [Rhodothermales bacterium]